MDQRAHSNSVEAPDVDGAGCQTCGTHDRGLPECDDCFDARWGKPVLPIETLAAATLAAALVPLEAAL